MLSSKEIADWFHKVAGLTELPDTPHDRLIHLANLQIMFDAVWKVGWQEHTGDWDWFTNIEALVDGHLHIFRGCGAMEFGTATEHKPVDDITACVDWQARTRPEQLVPGEKPKQAVTHVWLEIEEVDGDWEQREKEGKEPEWRAFPIADVRRVRFDEEH